MTTQRIIGMQLNELNAEIAALEALITTIDQILAEAGLPVWTSSDETVSKGVSANAMCGYEAELRVQAVFIKTMAEKIRNLLIMVRDEKIKFDEAAAAEMKTSGETE